MESVWSFIIEISAPISAIGTLLMTWCLYRLNSKSDKKERYFRHMVDLYYKIEEDYSVVLNIGSNNNSTKRQSMRRIEVNSSLMIYYLLRIPGFYKKRCEFLSILCDISHHPESYDNYDKLSYEFQEFCWELQDKKNKKHTGNFDYDGRPIEQ